jgi:hypothetical protein
MGWKVDLVLTIEKKPDRIVVKIEEKLGDLALGLWQRLGVDQVHGRMKGMAYGFFGMVDGVIVMAAVMAHSGHPVMLCGQLMVLCGMPVQVLRAWFVWPFVPFVGFVVG